MSVLLAFLALSIERLFGYPEKLLAAIGHPVIWIGRLIEIGERILNREVGPCWKRRLGGIALLVIILFIVILPAFLLQRFLGWHLIGVIALAVLASSLLAQKSLEQHVDAVADALQSGGIEGGRRAVSMIVGRDPGTLDEAGVARAAIESLAENFSDGVVAPAFWLAVAGLPGAAAYKAINTADSMIGHKSTRYEDFGWASARLDDLVNLPASRLTALLLLLAAVFTPGASASDGWKAVIRDARGHRSPNAGWPEAAMAGALGLALGGPRHYAEGHVDDAWMGKGGRREVNAADIRRALRLYRLADGLLIGIMGLLTAGIMLHWQ